MKQYFILRWRKKKQRWVTYEHEAGLLTCVEAHALLKTLRYLYPKQLYSLGVKV